MTSFLKKTAAVAALSLVATPAFAHTGGTVLGFHSGVLHPVYGLDHLMAMVAVGVWSAAQPTRRAWHGPAVFVALLAVGALLGVNGVAIPMVEPGILASVIVLGLMIAAARWLPSAAGLAAIGGFALLHGHAHGTEATGALAGYMAGFMLASAMLHMSGYGVGRFLTRLRFGLVATGLAVAAGGLALVGS